MSHLYRRLYSSISQSNRRWYSNEHFTVQAPLGTKSITFSSGKYARLADGATVVQCGNTTVMVTAVSSQTSRISSGVPLLVDYRERASAAGRIPHNFLRRELRSSDREILISRLIDRSIRPLFPEGYAYDTQVICNLLAVDGQNDPEILSINGASATLAISNIPWAGPIAAVRVGICDDKFVINPSSKELTKCDLNLVIACTKDRIVMIEGFGNEIPEEKFCEAVKYGLTEVQPLLDTLTKLQELNKKSTRDVPLIKPSNEFQEAISKFCYDRTINILRDSSHSKMSRDELLFALCADAEIYLQELGGELYDQYCEKPFLVKDAFWNSARSCMRTLVLDDGRRCDGRNMTDLRPIECEVDLFEPLHGSARFRRGETQILSTVTFDSPESAAKADLISLIIGAQKSRNFMLHYEFPPFATNVTGHFLMTGRREIGHGALAEHALRPLLPNDFPFTIRVSSQVTDSNGSSSMATVCGSSLALFDAGVSMSKSAAGVACGLILEIQPGSESIQRYQILTDLSGIEDALGHMDFKMAGTRDGITSCQIDIKRFKGLTYELFEEAVVCSRESRHKVLDIMDQCQSSPRQSLKDNGPVYETMEVPLSKRHKLIGTGGHKIRALVEETGAQLTTVDDEIMSIFAPSQTVMDEVLERVDILMNAPDPEEHVLDVGSIYNAHVVDIRPFGLILEIMPGRQRALLHLSQMDHRRISHPRELNFQIGQELSVKYFGKDPMGRIRISRKALLKNPLRKNADVDMSNKKADSSLFATALEKAILKEERKHKNSNGQE